jgi:hypothetical protein
MGKVIANILLFGLAIGLTIFTATRTLHLLGEWLPPDNQEVMKYLGLIAFEGGLYFWSFYFVKGAAGSVQRGIALMMVVVCFIAVALCVLGDMFLVGAETGKLPPIAADQKQALVATIAIVVMLNVGAFLAAKLCDPAKLREYAVQDSEDIIYADELRAIRGVAPSVAAQMAPIRSQQWVMQTWDRLLPGTQAPQMYAQLPQYTATPEPEPVVQAQPVAMQQTATVPQLPAAQSEQDESVFEKLVGKVRSALGHPATSSATAAAELPAPIPVSTPAPAPAPMRLAPRPFLQAQQSQTAQARRSLRRRRKQQQSKAGGA